MRIILPIVILSLIFFTCKKQKNSEDSFWHCGAVELLDSVSQLNKLTGSWKWIKQKIPLNQQYIDPNKVVVVTFESNGNFNVTENTIIVTQGRWGIKHGSYISWQLDLSVPNSYLTGDIIFCENTALFNNSPIDGPLNYFQKR